MVTMMKTKLITSLQEAAAQLPSILDTNNTNEYFAYINHNLEVSYGYEDDINKEYAVAHGVPIYDIFRDGGTIVYFPGDISVGVVHQNSDYDGDWIMPHMLKDFAEYLKSCEIDNVEFSENDILIDGFKVASAAGHNLPPTYKRCYESMHYSMSVDLELIQNICKKPMKKIPKSLLDFNITREEIVSWTDNWLFNYFGEHIVS